MDAHDGPLHPITAACQSFSLGFFTLWRESMFLFFLEPERRANGQKMINRSILTRLHQPSP